MVSYQTKPGSLVDILDKVLDKGLVVAGDIQVSLANVELLTIKIRLLVCSIDKAQEIGLDWWRSENYFRGDAPVPVLPAAPPLPARPVRRVKRRRDDRVP